MKDVTHDDLTKHSVDLYRKGAERKDFEIDVEYEAHYNYYGSRGVADYFIKAWKQGQHSRNYIVGEVKTILESANEVVRQFNRMEKYFFKDEDRPHGAGADFELCVLATTDNVIHLIKNAEMYDQEATKILHPDSDYVVFLRDLLAKPEAVLSVDETFTDYIDVGKIVNEVDTA